MVTVKFNGARSDESFESFDAALEALQTEFPEMETHDEADRILVWEDEASAANDAGQHALCEIVVAS